MQKDTIVEISILQCQKIPEEMRIGLENYFSSFGNSKEPILLIQKPLKNGKQKNVSRNSHSAENLEGILWGFSTSILLQIIKFQGDPLETSKNFRKKSQSKTARGESHSVGKSGKGTLLLWNGFYFILEALDAFKLMKY